ncbi:carboxypeptidase-like regulatory domain-containing protein [Maribacter sp. ACAM166]|uniref:carboxypeptidase-like regulatory domain-containing protein n=1 Tax=Maribacter sp. ACAM166 TaxID=2508996 RepID=UPI0010FEEC75|nr:carboxypeptidase-like regulatory domain-containing protein [Maribacter sp. ACAM166]TLP71118.1 hypothetical protein ES765_20215 [Maribacter sp. ACAM166]
MEKNKKLSLLRKVFFSVDAKKNILLLPLVFAVIITNTYKVNSKDKEESKIHLGLVNEHVSKIERSNLFLFQTSISGQVLDQNNQPLPGASVVEKGTVNGTQTDFDGNFNLEVSSGAVLLVSYIGYASQEITIGTKTNVTIVLEESASGLDEVVVIGYGTQKEALLTGSVGLVKKDEITKVTYANSASVLQGRVPGVRVESNGGAPGAGVNVVIRGTGSFGNDQPLYVIDGNIVGSMSFLNPNDIESVSVLKDASSAAIYGSRASNGVVLITTKKGSVGDVKINFESILS